MDGIWRLPGPARFADTARVQFDRGSSVLVGLPAVLFSDTGFQEGLRHAVDVHFDVIDPGVAADRPVASVVAEQMGIEDITPGPQAASALAGHPGLHGRRLAIHLAGKAEETASWVDFIRSFQAAARPIPTADRPLLLVTGPHATAADLASGADLAPLWWWGVLNRIDTACHVQEQLPSHERSDLLRDTIAEVAGFDLGLASFLAVEWDGDEATLPAALTGYAGPDWPSASVPERLPHTSTPLGAPPSALADLWDLGLVDCWDTFAVYLHACSVAPGNNRLRIWRAQLRYLMPLIDEERARLETWLRREVRGLPKDKILEPRELDEIVQRDYRLKSWRGGGRKRLVSWLRDTRNALAHMETLPHDEISRGKRLIWEDRQRGLAFGGRLDAAGN